MKSRPLSIQTKSIRYGLATIGALSVSFALALIPPVVPRVKGVRSNGVILAGAQADADVMGIVSKKCASCHSASGELPIYSRFAPASWLIASDIQEARSHWDVSQWDAYSPEERMQVLSQLAVRARVGSMPPTRYTLLHPGSKLSKEEKVTLYEWARRERRRLRSLTPVSEEQK